MSGGYFSAFTPGGTQYSSTYAAPAPAYPPAPYGFTAPTATGYATAFQQAAGTPSRPEGSSVGFAYGSRPDGGYVGGAPPIYASPLTAAASGVAASVIAGLSAAATKTAAASTGPTVSPSTKLPTSAAASAGTSTYTGYDAAVYAAAANYLQSKASGGGSQWLGLKKSTPTTPNSGVTGYSGFGANSSVGSSGGRGSFPRKTTHAPRPVQLHYCEICKISCAGPQTYREHLEGQKHKKKEAQAQGETQPLAEAKASFRCDLCSVTCTGQDTYNAHVRGAKHQKTLKLHHTLGKPIPSADPIIIPPTNAQKPVADASGVKKVVGVPKVAFVGGQKLTTTGMIGKTEPMTEEKETDASVYLALEKEVQPVGEDYVELIKTEDGKSTQYFCKLCDCRFNDMNAKDMHLKGRRHRLQFKKKVNPELEVEMKAPIKNRRVSDEKMRREMRYPQRDSWGAPGMYQSPMMAPPVMFHGPVPLFGGPAVSRQLALANDLDDQYVLAKHAAIYPSDEETKGILTMVTNIERALKTVSDHFAEEDKRKKEAEKQNDNKIAGASDGPVAVSKAAPVTEERLLKGAMRVGVLSKGLILRGDPGVQLVVLCSEKPTQTLLGQVADLLPQHLAAVTSDEYEVEKDVPEAAINVTSASDKITVTISLTSIFVREPVGEAANKPDPIDVLDKQKCLEALASLRHAKWFQAKCANLQSCSTILRILRDLCQRVPTWAPLTAWTSELLVEKVLSSAGAPLGPGEALRRMFEAVASGLLLPGGPGLLDPCEKESVDAIASMVPQQREDITASAQHALRLIAFKQIYKILGIERSAINTPVRRKRPLEPVESAEGTGNGKKDKKEDGAGTVATAAE